VKIIVTLEPELNEGPPTQDMLTWIKLIQDVIQEEWVRVERQMHPNRVLLPMHLTLQ
jgi:hypothetical protein